MLLGIGIGIVAALGGLRAIYIFRQWHFLRNKTPDWSAPGWIPKGDFNRFEEALQNVFPTATARSYVFLDAYRPVNLFRMNDSETKFFIRSAGKRKGQHRFMVELRLSVNERDKANRAILLLKRLGLEVKRTDKSHGQIIFKTEAIEEYEPLLIAAKEFHANILNCTDKSPVSIHWHIANYYGRKK